MLAAAASLWLAASARTGSGQQQQGEGARGGAQAQGASKKEPAPKKGAQDEVDRGIIAPTVPEFKADTQAYALVVGVSKYPNLPPKAQLKFADADAQAMRDFLVSDKGGFRQENVTLLLNEEATREQIVREFDRLQNLSGPGSLVLIYFAGHGVVNPSQQGFLLASDSRVSDLLLTGIDMGIFNSALEKMRSRSVVVISDACHSGAIGDLISRPGASGPVTNLSTRSFAEPAARRDQTSFIFSASSPTQSSIEKTSLGHGLFTYYILQALNGSGDADGDGVVTSVELYSYVAKKIGEESVSAEVKQVPEYNPSFDKSIPLAVVGDAGRKKYRDWFGSDPLVTRWSAAFDDAVKGGRLTRPQQQSAWDFYVALADYSQTPPAVVAEKKGLLLSRLTADAERVIAQSPNDPGPWDEARSNLEKAFEVTRDNALRAKQFYCSVMYHHHLGETGRAERECENALNLIEEGQSQEPLISVKIGQFYAGLKKWEKAKRAYRLAVDKNPPAAWLVEYAAVLVRLGSFAEAEEQARRALKADQNFLPGLKLLTEILLHTPRKERLAEARTLIEQARTLIEHSRRRSAEDIDAEELFGRVLLASGEPEQAVASLLKVTRQRTGGERRERSLLYLSRAFAQAGDLDRAISALREAAQSGSQNVETYDTLAGLLNERGDIEEAIAVAQKAAAMTGVRDAQTAERLRLVAEYLERSGQLVEAAYKYREAGRTAPDAKLGTSYETRARVLFLRADRAQEAGPLPRVIASKADRTGVGREAPLIIPGGRDALERLSGVILGEPDTTSLARVFDAALRNPSVASRLTSFYTQYPTLARKVGLKGGGISGSLDLPALGQPLSPDGKEALKFFGVEDKKGKREIKTADFEARRHILEALGGDAEKLRKGEAVKIKYQNDELPVLLGTQAWAPSFGDPDKAAPEQQFLAFLETPQAMRKYVGLSMMPEAAARQFQSVVFSKENAEDLPAAIYFAAPYLRFTEEGTFYIPGQRQGELNWQRMLKTVSAFQIPEFLFRRDNGGALYLFCALSAAGEAGDFIARSPGFEQFFKLMQKSTLPASREPFDFIDLVAQLRVENEQLRLPKSAEVWLGQPAGGGDALQAILTRAGKFSAGQQIPLVKQIAALSQIERERPDWAANPKLVELIATQVGAGKEAQVALALDLQMSGEQLIAYFARLDKLDAVQPQEARTATVRLFQSAFELLRQTVRNSTLEQTRVTQLTDGLLRLEASSGNFAPQVVSFFKTELLGADAAAAGEQVETRLGELLTAGAPLELPPSGRGASPQANAVHFDASKAAQQRINAFLARQKLTRLSAVVDAAAALEALGAEPSSSEALARLKASAERFFEPEPEPEPKKKKTKQPVAPPPSFKRTVAALSSPVPPQVVSELRDQLAPHAGEALLGYVYAAAAPDNFAAEPGLVRGHDFGAAPWGEAQVGAGGKMRGGVARLGRSLARMSAQSSQGAAQYGNELVSAFTEATLESSQLVGRRWVSNRAGEYVARTMDLGEDVLALAYLGDQTAAQVLTRLETMSGQRRAGYVKALVERGEIGPAIRALTLSELYALGQTYFERRLGETPAPELSGETGALGALARVVARSQPGEPVTTLPLALRREVRQFGMVASTRAGLSRLELVKPEPYEYGASFREGDRLAERVQDLKLAIVRRSHRVGGTAGLMLSPAVSSAVLQQTLAEAKKATDGTPPPARDWLGHILAARAFDSRAMTQLIEQLSGSAYMRQTPRASWQEDATRGTTPPASAP